MSTLSWKKNDAVDCWFTQEPLDAIGTVKEAMPLGSYIDMYRCIHFADDMAEEEGEIWEDTYTDVKHKLPRSARHWQKFVDIEDGFNKRWKACVQPGR